MTQQQDQPDALPLDAPDFWPEALELIHAAPIALLATAHGAQPHVRPVTPAYVGLDAYVLTSQGAPKIHQIESNDRVELLHWTADFRHLNLAGRAEISFDVEKIVEVAPYFPYVVDDFFGPDLRPPALIKIRLRRVSITTFKDIIADKLPRIWRASS